jgi:hypothetical protein
MTIFQINVSLENNGKKAEIRVAAFVAESNLSFNVMDHLSQEIRTSFCESEIAKRYTNNRTKATPIVNNVTGFHGFEKTLNWIQNHKFSLIVDGAIKSLTLVCRMVNTKPECFFFGIAACTKRYSRGTLC